MFQREFAIAGIVLLVVAIGSAGAYLAWNKQSNSSVATTEQKLSSGPAAKKPEPKTAVAPSGAEAKPVGSFVDWNRLLSNVESVLKKEFPDAGIGDSREVMVHEEADITGDGIPEALIDLGTGGAYSDLMTLVRIEAGKPVAARFNQPKRKNYTDTFLVGASVRHGSGVIMLPEKRAIAFTGSSTDDSGEVDFCGVGVFQWNAATRTFDWNESLAEEIEPKHCERVRNQPLTFLSRHACRKHG